MRTIDELIDTTNPAWPMVETWIRNARNQTEVLTASEPQRGEALVATQVTTHSTLGAIIYETGGLLVDSGWLRILGSGHPRLPRSLPDWNAGRTVVEPGAPPLFLLVADDVVGGFFAINGGGLGGAQGNVCYFAPDRQEWEDLDRGYTDFINWCLSGDLELFYSGQRWAGWEAETVGLAGDRAYSIYPPLWAQGPPIGERSRGAVPVAELYGRYVGDDA